MTAQIPKTDEKRNIKAKLEKFTTISPDSRLKLHKYMYNYDEKVTLTELFAANQLDKMEKYSDHLIAAIHLIADHIQSNDGYSPQMLAMIMNELIFDDSVTFENRLQSLKGQILQFMTRYAEFIRLYKPNMIFIRSRLKELATNLAGEMEKLADFAEISILNNCENDCPQCRFQGNADLCPKLLEQNDSDFQTAVLTTIDPDLQAELRTEIITQFPRVVIEENFKIVAQNTPFNQTEMRAIMAIISRKVKEHLVRHHLQGYVTVNEQSSIDDLGKALKSDQKRG